MSMQYIVTRPFREAIVAPPSNAQQGPRESFRKFPATIQQPQTSLDILPGLLDLPSGAVPPTRLERYLKLLALFYERIIVPDGWLHCKGPISEYLRGLYRIAIESGSGEYDPRFTDNLVFQLLQNEILVPALRGQRPSEAGGKPDGFDIFDVWAGVAPPLGVHFDDPRERMMILDPGEENEVLLRGVGTATKLFVDWTSPHLSVFDGRDAEGNDLALWDTWFTDTVRELLCDSPIALLRADEFQLFWDLGVLTDRTALAKLEGFWKQLVDRFRDSLALRCLRRGSFERLVGEAFGLDRLESYDQLRNVAARSDEQLSTSFSSTPIVPKGLLGHVLLDRITTIQETLFTLKFNCCPGMPDAYSVDAWDAGLLAKGQLEHDVERFQPMIKVLHMSPINLEALTVPQILRLRDNHKAYFDAARNCRASKALWEDNPALQESLIAYISDIANAAPPPPREEIVLRYGTRGAITAAVGSAISLASPWIAAIVIAGLGPVLMWSAQKVKAPISRLLARSLEPKFGRLVKRHRDRGRVDLTLRIMGLETLQRRHEKRE